MKERFSIEKPEAGDKDVWVFEEVEDDGDGLRFRVDYDDVNHPIIRQKIKKMVAILNKHWED